MRLSADLKPPVDFFAVRDVLEEAVDIELGISDGPAEARKASSYSYP
jgi:hypothetical protein